MKQNTKKKIGKLQIAILVRTVLPMLIMGVVIAVTAIGRYKSSLTKEVNSSLLAVATTIAAAYDEIYPGDYNLVGEQIVSLYKGEQELTGDFSIIDGIKEDTGIDITLFYKDTRILTTLRDEYGERYVATGVHAAIYHQMEKTEAPLYYISEIRDIRYYICYIPIHNSDGTLFGMVAVAKPVAEIEKQATKAANPIWVIMLLCMVFAGFVSINYTKGLVYAIQKIKGFLAGMVSGELSNNMEGRVLGRQDEVGEVSKAIVEMQSAIRVLVERDPLTALYNRRYGTAKLKKLQKHAEKSGMPYAVALSDIDFFKKVNDTYGHEAGDIVLKRVADTMRKTMAGKGFVTRWGGEEFLLIFDKCDQEDAAKVLQHFLRTIQKMEIAYGDLVIKITMTVGVVDGKTSDDYGELLRQADARLYYGKTNGRNQVVVRQCEEVLQEEEKSLDIEESESKQEPGVVMTFSDNVLDIDTSELPDAIEPEEDNSTLQQVAHDEILQEELIQKIMQRMADQLIKEESEGE
ncbi:MAG TPA: diguanylate cyclase [Lachnospiraceae bacterium]|nr:diguanylate cyclase [Lachnospiraceae bacterium]HPF29217.1 diguanylate cyclase [Lachnospiraceae bacterium]